MPRDERGPAAAAPVPAARPLILIYSAFPGRPPSLGDGCPVRCDITTDRGRLAEADAVVYHIPSWREPVAFPARPDQKAVAWSMESEVNYPLLADSAFMGRFDVTMTYRQDATIWCPYFDAGTAAALRRPPQSKTAPSPAACFVSNRHTAWDREGYIRELMRYASVDSYGRALSNRLLAEDRGRETRSKIVSRYKFTLAFENSLCRDYVTEKFFEPMIWGSVPVYLGAPNVDEFAPADRCYIDAADFSGPRDLAAYLRHLDSDDRAYDAYLRWKVGGLRQSFLDKAARLHLRPFCRLCLRLYRDRAAAAPKPRRPAAVDRARPTTRTEGGHAG